jgi:predicted phosphodiesterase
MRCLILSDVHANIDALDAIDEPWDRLIVAGDLVDYGAAPEESVRWVSDRRAMAACGNHDFAMATGADCRSSPAALALSIATRKHFRRLLSREVLDYLAALPRWVSFEYQGAQFHLLHATPREPLYEYLAGDAPEKEWRQAVGAMAEENAWLIVGHTHRPFIRRVGSLTILNPGSAGMPSDGHPRGCYAVWEDGRVELKRFGYDIDRAVSRLRDSGLPEVTIEGMEAALRHARR